MENPRPEHHHFYQAPPEEFDLNESEQKANTILVAIFILAVLISIGVIWWLIVRVDQPTVVFNKALSDALSTRSIQVNRQAYGMISTIKEDLVDIKDPITSTSSEASTFDIPASTINGYSTLTNTYILYTNSGSSRTTPTDSSTLNKWIQIRSQGTISTGVDDLTLTTNDASSLLFNDLVFGNFPKKERDILLDYIKKNHVYQFDSRSVDIDTIDGQPAMAYDVTFNQGALATYEQKVASYMGLSSAAIENALKSVQDISEATIYINSTTDQFIQFNVTTGNNQQTITYSHYNTTNLPAAPTASLTFEQFNELLGGGL
jgi:hypothetical protein